MKIIAIFAALYTMMAFAPWTIPYYRNTMHEVYFYGSIVAILVLACSGIESNRGGDDV